MLRNNLILGWTPKAYGHSAESWLSGSLPMDTPPDYLAG